METVLIVDDDADLRAIISDVIKREGFAVREAVDGHDALRSFKSERPDAVILDLKMPGVDGLEVLQQIRNMDNMVPVIMLTAYGDISSAVEAVKKGAYDFLAKPPDFDKLIITLKRSIEKYALQREADNAKKVLNLSLEQTLGKSEAIKRIIKQINQVAQTDFSVIIQGETGSGKSVIANEIKSLSRRANRPFVRIDIGLIPETIVESELFGYKKGAFTGASRDRAGYFQSAHTGTIFIDELQNMSHHIQSKLLSVIEQKKVYPLGSTTPIDIDVRVICATNKDIRSSVMKHEFREDLFYRLGEFIIDVPPLRERIEDIVFFAEKFIYEAGSELNRQITGIDDDAMYLLQTYPWPGNIRELKNVMKRAVLMNEDEIIRAETIRSLLNSNEKVVDKVTMMSLKESIKELEKNMIKKMLEKTGGNKLKASEILEISYKSLLDKIKEYNIR